MKVFCDMYGDSRVGLSTFQTTDKKVLDACEKAEKTIKEESKQNRKKLELTMNGYKNKKIVPTFLFFFRKPKSYRELLAYSGVQEIMTLAEENYDNIKNRVKSIRAMFEMVDGNEIYLDASDSRFVSMWNSYDAERDGPIVSIQNNGFDVKLQAASVTSLSEESPMEDEEDS